MHKMLIAAMLATSAVMASAAQAAPKGMHNTSAVRHLATLSQLRAVYGQMPTSGDPTVTAPNRDWENRSLFYRGPTYIGRY
jgi:hypothetical protein